MTTKTAYVVRTPKGFLGQRRYDYGLGKSAAREDRPFKDARIFARLSDATQAYVKDGKVVEVTITLKEAQ